ncbi:Bcr/CflA family drug resistance efflux transporter [Corticibacter populi]|uniref:Bcr/CflA family efflux transporter n=1 Tax=Corticibacter populi TaxID=1550736 RepID=A0A3M6QTW8_9BURK|nr:Bcr/CflA family multidrug efflux MFS transporter [Corticibacter populi]RMX06475.1 Bcr/CflA family drug resistance efflux transporter [Corticibacter populi]RZS31968.1 DHA1 family bicyclomycin/chloramphenicol resistance-like MFS transporter [Corticibacter populi]
MPILRRPVPFGVLVTVLAILTAFAPFATDMYLPGMSLMEGAFQTTPGRMQATVSVFFLGLAIGQVIYGPLSDRFGRKPPLLAGTVIYTLAALACAWASSVEMFIALRLLQALGGAAGMLIVRAIISDLFDRTETARVLSLMMMVMMLAPIIAPLAGGWLMVHLGWQSIFWFMFGYGLLCVALALWCVPESLPPARRQPLGFASTFEAYRSLLGQAAFVVPALAAGLAMASMFAYITGSEFVFIQLHGLTPQQYSALFAFNAFGIILANLINRRCLLRWPVERIMGMALAAHGALGLVLLAVVGTAAPLMVFVPALWLFILTLGFIGANGAAVAMGATGRHGGSGSGLIGLMQFSLAFIVSSTVAATQNGTAYPMVLAIMVCALVACGVWFAARRH